LVCVVFSSCQKANLKNENQAITLKVSLTPDQLYKLDLSQYGDADDIASISTQAADFITSEVNFDTGSQKYFYTYTSSLNSKTALSKTEKVVLSVHEPSGRRHCDQTIITINFTINE
jgi:hypothetical protein